MITCNIQVTKNIDDLHKIFLSEKLQTNRAKCSISKDKTLNFLIEANDPVSMKAFVNSILKVIETYNKVSRVK